MKTEKDKTEENVSVVEKETTKSQVAKEIYPIKQLEEHLPEKPKVYLTDEEVREWQMVSTQLQILSMKKQELVECELIIFKNQKKSVALKEDIITNESAVELADTRFKSKLEVKYGNFKVGENNEVIKVGK